MKGKEMEEIVKEEECVTGRVKEEGFIYAGGGGREG